MQGPVKKSCPQHFNQIKYICLQKQCVGNQIFCTVCSQNHNNKYKKHQVVQYEMFKKSLEVIKKEISNDKIVKRFREEFNFVRKEIMELLNNIQQQALSNSILDVNQDLQDQVFQGQISLITQNQMFKSYVQNPSTIKNIKDQSAKSSIHIITKLRKTHDEIQEALIQLKKSIQTWNSAQNIKQKRLINRFSHKNKHTNIQISPSGQSIKLSQKQTLGHSQLCLLQQPLSPISPIISFTINSITSRRCMAFGLSILQKAKQNSFFRCWRLGDGSYSIFINTFGEVLSNHHTNKGYCGKLLKFSQFRNGDKITIMVDFMKMIVIFTKNFNDKFWMPIDLDKGKLYPFVALSFMDDQVQIN